MEIYKEIKGYNGYYEISNFGNIASLKGGKRKILKPSLDTKGYLGIKLFINGKYKRRTIHQLVAGEFLNYVPNGYYGMQVDHINGDKTDNRLSNLQVLTRRQNLSKVNRGSSNYTGVSLIKSSGKWQSNIVINKKQIYLGVFNSECEAHLAYLKALSNG